MYGRTARQGSLDSADNTPSPIALKDPHDRLLLAAFGAGLVWGAATLTWPDITALPVHTYRD
ncbi:hypothetical protein AB0H69_35695 [Streptomyces phaeochromogenes]|uniref:hypothetical protein n=1 Tax=Streptomyces phaeochromogenes TaxID=1923 RepID=UPI0033F628E0